MYKKFSLSLFHILVHIFLHFGMLIFITQPPTTKQLIHLQWLIVFLVILMLIPVGGCSTVNGVSRCPPNFAFHFTSFSHVVFKQNEIYSISPFPFIFIFILISVFIFTPYIPCTTLQLHIPFMRP